MSQGARTTAVLSHFWEHPGMSHGDYKDFFRGACDGDLEVVRHCLRRGVDVDFIHPELQSTALFAAIEAGRVEVALVLLDHGADPAQRSPLEGIAPLEAAEAAGLDEVGTRLRASPGEPTTTPTRALIWGVRAGSRNALTCLIRAGGVRHSAARRRGSTSADTQMSGSPTEGTHVGQAGWLIQDPFNRTVRAR